VENTVSDPLQRQPSRARRRGYRGRPVAELQIHCIWVRRRTPTVVQTTGELWLAVNMLDDFGHAEQASAPAWQDNHREPMEIAFWAASRISFHYGLGTSRPKGP
jgi:hypothetical protein